MAPWYMFTARLKAAKPELLNFEPHPFTTTIRLIPKAKLHERKLGNGVQLAMSSPLTNLATARTFPPAMGSFGHGAACQAADWADLVGFSLRRAGSSS